MPTDLQRIKAQAEAMQEAEFDFAQYFEQFDKKAYSFFQKELAKYPQENGRLNSDYDYTDSFARLDAYMLSFLINEDVLNYVNGGIKDFDNLRKENINLHNEINGLGLSKNQSDYVLNLQSQVIQYNLTTESAIRSWFINPFKAALSTAVETGASVSTMERFLQAWYKKEKQSGILSGVNSIPNFSQYAGQLARDAVFKTNNAVNDSVRAVFGAEKFRYVGSLVRDSRPFCRHLIKLDRLIAYEEVPKIASQYPQGLMKPFTIDTFSHNCGGYNCRHQQFPIISKI